MSRIPFLTHPFNSVKALSEIQSTDFNQKKTPTDFILCWSTTRSILLFYGSSLMPVQQKFNQKIYTQTETEQMIPSNRQSCQHRTRRKAQNVFQNKCGTGIIQSISCHWRTCVMCCITANVLQTKVDAQCDKPANELSRLCLPRSMFSRYSQLFVEMPILTYPHLHLVPP